MKINIHDKEKFRLHAAAIIKCVILTLLISFHIMTNSGDSHTKDTRAKHHDKKYDNPSVRQNLALVIIPMYDRMTVRTFTSPCMLM